MTLLILPSSSLREIAGEPSRESRPLSISPMTYGATRRTDACSSCGTALAEHFDEFSAFIPCAKLEVCAACGHGMRPDPLHVICTACDDAMVGSLGEA